MIITTAYEVVNRPVPFKMINKSGEVIVVDVLPTERDDGMIIVQGYTESHGDDYHVVLENDAKIKLV